MTEPVICAPLRVEAAAVRLARTRVVRTGMGPARSTRAAAALGDRPRLVAGVAGGLDPAVRPGDVVVASEVRGPGHAEPVPCPSAPLLAGALRRLGLTVHIGPIASVPTVAAGARLRQALTEAGALAVDCESAWLAPARSDTPFAVVRVITDTVDRPVWSPGIVTRGIRGLRVLRRAVPALDAWANAPGNVTLHWEVS